jgi:hypothetical protein
MLTLSFSAGGGSKVTEESNGRSRRSLITAGVAAVAAAVASRLAIAPGVRAADGDPLILGVENESSGFTVLRNTNPGGEALTLTVPGGGTALRAESESGAGVFGMSHDRSGSGIFGANNSTGAGVVGVSDAGHGIEGNTGSGVGLHGESALGLGGLALRTVGPVKFSTALIARIPLGQASVTVAPLSGVEDERLDLTEQSKVFCTLLGHPGAGRWIQYVSIDPVEDTFTVHLTAASKADVPVCCFVVN